MQEIIETTYYGSGPAVTLKNGVKAVRIQVPCVEGCRSRRTVYVNKSMYAYNIYGKMVCCMRDEVYRCPKHQGQ